MLNRMTLFIPDSDEDNVVCEVLSGEDVHVVSYKLDIDTDWDDEHGSVDWSYWRIDEYILNGYAIFNGAKEILLPTGLRREWLKDDLETWAGKNGFEYKECVGEYIPTANSIKFILMED